MSHDSRYVVMALVVVVAVLVVSSGVDVSVVVDSCGDILDQSKRCMTTAHESNTIA